MKKQLLLFVSITFLSFFLIVNVVAQDQKKKVEKKAKTEQVKKEIIPAKCASCQSADKCLEMKTTKADSLKTDKKKVVKKK